MNILIIGGLNEPASKFHYSDFKTLQLALGFVSMGHIVVMPTESDHHNDPQIMKIPFHNIKVYDYHLVIFTRENYIRTLYDSYQLVRDLCSGKLERDQGFPIICARYGRHLWYKNIYETLEEFYNAFDYHFPQEYNFCKRMVMDLGEISDYGKIWPSSMACPENIDFSPVPPFNKQNKTLIYIGRLRQVPPRYQFIIEFMKRLGNKYHLLILPGSFNKNEDSTKCYPKENKEWLVKMFSTSSNIDVLDPVPWGDHWNYLYHADYGLDFSPMLNSKGQIGGNAKLVEYMRAGLPSITEPSVSNSELLGLCRGGIVTRTSHNIDDYVYAFQNMEYIQWDRKNIARIMMETNNWRVRASEMISHIGKTSDLNLGIY